MNEVVINMKKIFIPIGIILIIITIGLLFILQPKPIKTDEELIEKARNEFEFDDEMSISIIGEQKDDRNTVIWYYVDNHIKYYALEFEKSSEDEYFFLRERSVTTYAKDIMTAHGLILINNEECVEIRRESTDTGKITVTKVDKIPYFYNTSNHFGGSITGFYNANGEEMQFR